MACIICMQVFMCCCYCIVIPVYGQQTQITAVTLNHLKLKKKKILVLFSRFFCFFDGKGH